MIAPKVGSEGQLPGKEHAGGDPWSHRREEECADHGHRAIGEVLGHPGEASPHPPWTFADTEENTVA